MGKLERFPVQRGYPSSIGFLWHVYPHQAGFNGMRFASESVAGELIHEFDRPELLHLRQGLCWMQLKKEKVQAIEGEVEQAALNLPAA